jgi:Kef-type K+ transport system membrane component KefB
MLTSTRSCSISDPQGSALASTSLGTTFFVLRSQRKDWDLVATQLGTILTAAALVDDVIALVLLSYSPVLISFLARQTAEVIFNFSE